jgi:hypothetical protein
VSVLKSAQAARCGVENVAELREGIAYVDTDHGSASRYADLEGAHVD